MLQLFILGFLSADKSARNRLNDVAKNMSGRVRKNKTKHIIRQAGLKISWSSTFTEAETKSKLRDAAEINYSLEANF